MRHKSYWVAIAAPSYCFDRLTYCSIEALQTTFIVIQDAVNPVLPTAGQAAATSVRRPGRTSPDTSLPPGYLRPARLQKRYDYLNLLFKQTWWQPVSYHFVTATQPASFWNEHQEGGEKSCQT